MFITLCSTDENNNLIPRVQKRGAGLFHNIEVLFGLNELSIKTNCKIILPPIKYFFRENFYDLKIKWSDLFDFEKLNNFVLNSNLIKYENNLLRIHEDVTFDVYNHKLNCKNCIKSLTKFIKKSKKKIILITVENYIGGSGCSFSKHNYNYSHYISKKSKKLLNTYLSKLPTKFNSIKIRNVVGEEYYINLNKNEAKEVMTLPNIMHNIDEANKRLNSNDSWFIYYPDIMRDPYYKQWEKSEKHILWNELINTGCSEYDYFLSCIIMAKSNNHLPTKEGKSAFLRIHFKDSKVMKNFSLVGNYKKTKKKSMVKIIHPQIFFIVKSVRFFFFEIIFRSEFIILTAVGFGLRLSSSIIQAEDINLRNYQTKKILQKDLNPFILI